MFAELKTKLMIISVPFLLACLLFTSCSAIDKSNTQTAITEQEATFTGSFETAHEAAITNSFDTTHEATNQTEDIINRNTEKVIDSWDDYDASKLPLISAIFDRGIYLYGIKSDGVALYVGDSVHYYDWSYLTPRFILPRLQVCDYDADGKEELSVILYVGSGTGVSVENLHIVEISEAQTLPGEQSDNPNPEYFKDYMFSDYDSQLNNAIGFKTFTKAGELMGEITTHTKIYTISLKDFQSKDYGKINDDIVFGNIVRFNSENNKLTAEFTVGITCQSFAPPIYIRVIYADVDYSEGKFELKNFRFEENQE